MSWEYNQRLAATAKIQRERYERAAKPSAAIPIGERTLSHLPHRMYRYVTPKLVDFIRRKGPVSARDVAMRFGCSTLGAQARLSAAVESGQIERTEDSASGEQRWRATASAPSAER